MSPRAKVDPQLEDVRKRMRHSAAHVLAEAVTSLFPEAKLTIGPPTDDGFYYDFDVERPFTPEDLERIGAVMRKSIHSNHKFVEREVTRDEAMGLVKGNRYKLEIIEGIPEGERVTFTSHGTFEDLCRGGHVGSTGEIKVFKLLSSAGAYWRGDERNPMLQRIYGTAWESPQAQEAHLKRIEEAEKRDHRKLGRELKLFFFDPIAPAMPFFTPRGAFVVNRLVEYVRGLYTRYGYTEVITPQIFSTDLWKRSGHYDNYIENMFVMEIDEREYGVKPMNCPAAALVYKSDTRSYRDLPLRLADFGRLHRYERSGVTLGLTRVRSFSQDDAHIYCRVEQIAQEVRGFITMLQESYAVFGFNEARFTLSLRPEKRMGSDEIWDKAEAALESVLAELGVDFEKNPGEGAFYGPKIDVFVPDAIGREWQLGTVQLDFNQGERFDLEYQSEGGARERPVVIHRAMLGSLERFLGVLIEHTVGAFPVWLSPVQAVVVPIADRHNAYGMQVRDRLLAAGVRAELNDSAERMQAKIRDAQLQKVPYMLVVGDREMEAGAAAVRTRTGENLGAMSLDEIQVRLVKETAIPR
ncbi:MAG: threonine--tRNA ligase [Dehalococcoidia bacterium]|nr:threonine--tRNA ligase [Dehalococcoidia bacterium]MSQ34514.1 threonine--tRNA ligase [Dehalococcoidia bacterium]